jgi:hypothetical protein
VRDTKVRPFIQTLANRCNPGVPRTPEQSRDRKGAVAKRVAGKRSLAVAARIGASRSSTFMSRTQRRSPFGLDLHATLRGFRNEAP